MIITLQEEAMILGLRIHGPPITSTCNIDWSVLCSELLVMGSPSIETRGSIVSTRWLRQQFSHPPPRADDVIL